MTDRLIVFGKSVNNSEKIFGQQELLRALVTERIRALGAGF